MASIPKKSQKKLATERFLDAWNEHGLPGSDLTPEYVWHPERKYRFDFAFPSLKVAVEVEGRGYGRAGGHHEAAGAVRDSEKFNAAIECGWRVLRYQTRQLATKQGPIDVVEQVCRVLCELSPAPER